MTTYNYKIKTIGNACIIRFNNGEAADLKTILDTNYPNLTPTDRQLVVDYVSSIRPDIPYVVTGTI